MNSLVKQMALSFVYLNLLTGCLYGQCINGPCSLEHSRIVKSIKPYGAYWMKDGMTDAQRLDDIEQCGGGKGLYVGFPDAQIKAEREGDEATDLPARDRLSKKWSACMEANGYRYQSQ